MSAAVRREAVEVLLGRARGRSQLVQILRTAIESGDLQPGDRLPTVRRAAELTGLSLATVAAGWEQLRAAALVETRRRGGTTVRGAEPVDDRRSWSAMDLATGHPDQTTLPDLAPALTWSIERTHADGPAVGQITPALHDAVAARWPFDAEMLSTVGGANEAAVLAVAAIVEPGGLVAVNEPAMPGFIPRLRELGFRVVGVPSDDDGPQVAALAAAVGRGAAAFLVQPYGGFAFHDALSGRRRDELAAVLVGAGTVVIEEDILGPVAPDAHTTFGALLPGRVLRLQSYCRAFGIDLRTSVIGGPVELVERVRAIRSYGTVTNSALLQNALAFQLVAVDARAAAEQLTGRVRQRAQAFARELRGEGLTVRASGRSLALWVDVVDESAALAVLAAHGISLSTSAKTFVEPQTSDTIRITAAQLPDAPDRRRELVRLLARAARAHSAGH